MGDKLSIDFWCDRGKVTNMNTITIPAIPADWILHSGVIPAGDGYRTRVKTVLHKCDGYHPFVVHNAYEYNGGWAYENGSYCKTEEEGVKKFWERCK